MDEKLLKQVQQVMLSMAIDIRDFCDNNGIDYFLDGGTLLGAIRHKGFIPWDDDFDIGMCRKDYEKFKKLSYRLDNKYFFQDWETDEGYGLWFAKVRLLETTYKEAASTSLSPHDEFFIDIFPYDNFPDSKREREILIRKIEILKRALLAKTRYKVWNTNKGFSFIRYLSYNILRILLVPFSKEYLIKKYVAVSTAWDNNDTGFLYPQGNSKSGKFLLEKKKFNNYVNTTFEHEKFKILRCFDEFLTILYGDYMKLPPEGERNNRHNISRVVFPK